MISLLCGTNSNINKLKKKQKLDFWDVMTGGSVGSKSYTSSKSQYEIIVL
jgi:hypothetical protein